MKTTPGCGMLQTGIERRPTAGWCWLRLSATLALAS